MAWASGRAVPRRHRRARPRATRKPAEARQAAPLPHDSARASRKFLAADRVGNFELLEMEGWVGAKTEFAAELLFQLDEHRFVLGAETVEHLGVDEDAE